MEEIPFNSEVPEDYKGEVICEGCCTILKSQKEFCWLPWFCENYVEYKRKKKLLQKEEQANHLTDKT